MNDEQRRVASLRRKAKKLGLAIHASKSREGIYQVLRAAYYPEWVSGFRASWTLDIIETFLNQTKPDATLQEQRAQATALSEREQKQIDKANKQAGRAMAAAMMRQSREAARKPAA